MSQECGEALNLFIAAEWLEIRYNPNNLLYGPVNSEYKIQNTEKASDYNLIIILLF